MLVGTEKCAMLWEKKQFHRSSKLIIELPSDLAVSLLDIYLKKLKTSIQKKKNFCMDVHNSTSHNNRKVWEHLMSIYRWMDKTKCMLFIKGILLSHKEEWNPNKCYLNQPCTHAKWRSQIQKIVWCHLYEICRMRDRKQISGFKGLGKGEWEWLHSGYQISF